MAQTHSLACQQLQIQAHARGPVLAQVDAALQPGRVTAIVGPNGAGKSTLLSVLLGLRRAAAGAVLLDGQPLARISAPLLATRVAYMAQDTQLAFNFLVHEVVQMGRYPHRHAPSAQEAQIVQQALHSTGVAHLAQRDMATLSGGERARVHLARALAQVWQPQRAGPSWLLLDEPMAALDLQHQHGGMQLLHAQAALGGLGVVVVLHDLNLALRYADDVLLLAGPPKAGQGSAAVFGPKHEVLSAARIAQVWGVQAQLLHSADGQAHYVFSACAAPEIG